MSKTIAQKLAQAKYDQKAYDQILIKVRKGKREEYRQAAESLGLGQMELFRTAVEEYIRNRASEVSDPTEKISADERRLLDAAAKFPQDTRKLFLKLVEDLAAKLEAKGGDSNGGNGGAG